MKFNLKALLEAARAIVAVQGVVDKAAAERAVLRREEYEAWWHAECKPLFVKRRDELTRALSKNGVVESKLNETVSILQPGEHYATAAHYSSRRYAKTGAAVPGITEARRLLALEPALAGDEISLSALKSIGFTSVTALMTGYADVLAVEASAAAEN